MSPEDLPRGLSEQITEIQERILGADLVYTRYELVDIVGVPIEEARVLWRAMGYADVGEAVAFTDSDVTAFLRMMDLVRGGNLDQETASDLVRALGQTTSRLAEWHVNALAGHLERGGVIEPADGLAESTLGAFADELEQLMPDVEALLVYVWRRALATAVARAAATGSTTPEGEAGALTVGFADMVGYTRLSRRLPEHELAQLVQRFESVSADVVAAGGGRLVKTVGDEVLFVTTGAEDAALIAIRMHEIHAEDDTVPQVRVGLATGQVLSLMGDVFGTTVNLASRLTAMAKPGGTLVDPQTHGQLVDDDRFVLRSQRGRAVRGFGVLKSFVLARAPEEPPQP